MAADGAIGALKLVLEEHLDNPEILCVALGVLNSFSTTDGQRNNSDGLLF